MYDRTPGYSGIVRAVGSGGSWSTASSGSKDFYDVDYYPAAQKLEQVLAVNIATTPLPGGMWVCNPSTTFRWLWCDDLGNGRASVGVGFFEFTTGVAPPRCTEKTLAWGRDAPSVSSARVFDQKNTTIAQPEITVQWCFDARGRNQRASIVSGPLPRPLISALTGTVSGDPALKSVNIGGKPAHRTSFSIIYEFHTTYTVALPGGNVTYERGEKCQVTVDLIFAGSVVADLSANPCTPWLAVNQ